MTQEPKALPKATACPMGHSATSHGGGHSSFMRDLLANHGDDHDQEYDPIASAFSTYSAPLQPSEDAKSDRASTLPLYRVGKNDMWPDRDDDHVEPWAQTIHDMLRVHIGGAYFPCLGARAAMAHRTYRVGYYKNLAHLSSVAAMARDLGRFVNEYEKFADPKEGFCSFIALFKYPQSTDEDEFERLLFLHLQRLHAIDKAPWDQHYSPNPRDPNFAFSFGGQSFFIVGMHPGASRLSRVLARPALIFNPESQIRRLKESGNLQHFAESVRRRDIKYQGDINPSLPADANSSGGEASVYSGKFHPPGEPWECPFKPKAHLVKPASDSSAT